MIKPKIKHQKVPVLLLENLPKLGRRGEVVKVNRGFSRNYLFPNKKAMEVTPDNLYRIEYEKKKWFQEELKLKEELNDLAKKLKKFSVKIEMNANDDGHLFGSVNETMVVDAFMEKGFKLKAKALDLSEVKKELGVYEIKVKLHPEIIATTKIHVVSSKETKTEKTEE
jgi:large subunit ribosomal protein L9